MPHPASSTATAADALFQQGIEAHRAGRLDEAERLYRQILAADPGHAPALVHLGLIAQANGAVDSAEALLMRALDLRPRLAEAHFHLGNLYRAGRRLAEAGRCYRAAIDCAPAYLEAHNNLGYALVQTGRPEEAAECFRRALAIEPNYEGALTNLGNLLREQGKPDEALPYLQTAATSNPRSAPAQNNLGNAYKDLGRLDEAIASYRRAIDLTPNSAELHSNLGIVLQKLGDIPDAIVSFRHALALRPKSANAYRNLLSALLFDPRTSPEALFAEHRRFGALFSRPGGDTAWVTSRDPERRLRIGFVSSDFHDHPVARNLMPVLHHLDRSAFEVFLYSANPASDGLTARVRAMADGWRQISGESDEAAAARIQTDRVDILVLLAGRFDRNRPLIATYRAAPIQVSFHDPATSGLESIDYLLSDRFLTPRRGAERFVERVFCLPHFYVHPPLASAPPVETPPFRRNGYVTFGSCNKPSKLNDDVLRTWAELLRRVPGSRLLLKYRNQFVSPAVQERVTAAMRSANVDPARVQMPGETESFARHLRVYNAIDVALDPFPFTGSTTSFEALWMGVPLVTLAGQVMAARWTAAMLHALDLDDLVAHTVDGYVDLAARTAADPSMLEQLHATLRRRVESSPLCDEAGRARQVGRFLRSVWRRWCHSADVHG
ncbi:MAG: tetratricopeptide repeat protein [Alphaproteobacteria bacterium]|nr:tetratricopeptide repeat protein [Alphaproteobacteria bacterium]